MNSDIRRLRSNSPAALRPHKTRIILDKYSIKRFSKFAPTVAQCVILSLVSNDDLYLFILNHSHLVLTLEHP